VRFIEVMPIGEKKAWTSERFISIREILDRVRSLGALLPVKSGPLDGPANRYALKGAKGEIGLIGALSHHFCENCNRLRLTADGHLRGCLFSDRETDIKTPLREGKGNGHLLNLIGDAIMKKPKDNGTGAIKPRKCVRSMNSIGG
jgi:cyclic pyranopterin phosphate synthase